MKSEDLLKLIDDMDKESRAKSDKLFENALADETVKREKGEAQKKKIAEDLRKEEEKILAEGEARKRQIAEDLKKSLDALDTEHVDKPSK
jgi:hypothetical protein